MTQDNIPNSPELEQQVLAALMLTPHLFYDLEIYLRPSLFYDHKCAIIFEAFYYQVTHNQPADMISVVQRLRDTGKLDEVDGVSGVTRIAMTDSSSAYLLQKTQRLRELEMQRDLIKLGMSVTDQARDSARDVADTIEETERALTALQTGLAADTMEWDTVADTFCRDVLTPITYNAPIKTGLLGLDNLLNGGFHAPDLIVLGGRPSMGKTQFAIHFALEAARKGRPVFFASIEMTAAQLVGRVLGAQVDPINLRNHTLHQDDRAFLERYRRENEHLPITIADSERIRHLAAIKSAARRLKRMGKMDMLIIDYLQLIKTDRKFEKRYLEVGYITGELKALAKELQVPVLLLAQLSRPQKGNERQKPQMEDLRESGDIEQDADIILFPHRPSVYDPLAVDGQGYSWRNRGKIIVAKNREGQRGGETTFRHDDAFKTITPDWDDYKVKGEE